MSIDVRKSINLMREFSNEIDVPRARDNDYNYVFFNNKTMGRMMLSEGKRQFFWLNLELNKPIAIRKLELYDGFVDEYYINKFFDWLIDFAKSKGYGSMFLELNGSETPTQVTLYKNFGFNRYVQEKDDDKYLYYNF